MQCAMFLNVRHQKLDATTRLQEESSESTKTDHRASGELSSSTGRGSTSAGGGARGARACSAAGTRSRAVGASGAGGVGGSARGTRGGSTAVQDDGGGVVGADNESAGGVTSAGNRDGVDARGNSGDGGRDANAGVNSRLSRNDRVSSRLGGDGGGSSGLASHNTQRVGLLEESGLGEGVDRGLRNR